MACAMALPLSLGAQELRPQAEPPARSLGMVVISGSQPTSLPTQIPTTIEGMSRQQLDEAVNATDSEDALKYPSEPRAGWHRLPLHAAVRARLPGQQHPRPALASRAVGSHPARAKRPEPTGAPGACRNGGLRFPFLSFNLKEAP